MAEQVSGVEGKAVGASPDGLDERYASARGALERMAVIAEELEALLLDPGWPIAAALRRTGHAEQSASADLAVLLNAYMVGGGEGEAAWQGAYRCILIFGKAYAGLWRRRDVDAELPQQVVATIAVRLLGALLTQSQWEHLHYGPYDEVIWKQSGEVFLEALDHGYGYTPVADVDEHSRSVFGAYSRLLALHAAAVDKLPVDLMPTLLGMVNEYAAHTRVKPDFDRSAQYIVDPAAGEPPVRLAHAPEQCAGLWFLDTWPAAEVVMSGAENDAVRDGQAPGHTLCREHLLRHWARRPPVRRYRRHRLVGDLDAAEGLPDAIAVLEGRSLGTKDGWAAQDVSHGGVGICADEDSIAVLRINELVIVRPSDGGHWLLCFVRRIKRLGSGQAYLGLETVSSELSVAELDDGRESCRVILCGTLRKGAEVNVVSPRGRFAPEAPLYLAEGRRIVKLLPKGKVVSSVSCDMRPYAIS